MPTPRLIAPLLVLLAPVTAAPGVEGGHAPAMHLVDYLGAARSWTRLTRFVRQPRS